MAINEEHNIVSATGNSAAGFDGGNGAGMADRSASGLQYQRYQMGLTARGAALGQGLRVAPDPSQQFSNPPMSGGQFGQGHAKSMVSFGADSEPEHE
jgi:hypothetical protein